MKRIQKWVLRILVGIVILALAAAGLGAWLVRRPWPQASGTLQVPGLEAPVEIIRDPWGVPHIYAQNEPDLFFAQGYVHAQDRLWQMELNRRVSSGTLSEIAGSHALASDRFMRILGLRRAAEQSWQQLDPGSQAILDAYAKGVNAYIDTHRGSLPLEFSLLGDNPQLWTPVDSLTWGSLLALDEAFNGQLEIFQAHAVQTLGAPAAQQLFLTQDGTHLVVPDGVNYGWTVPTGSGPLSAVGDWRRAPFAGWGSNNWVVAGSHTATGKPFLANDTHLDLMMPSVWYENDLHGGRFQSAGFSFPGVPLVVMGRNQQIAWGITTLSIDAQDIYMEKLDNNDNPTRYEFMGQWQPLQVEQQSIAVRGGQAVPLKIFRTRHGPLVNDAYNVPKDKPVSLQWTLYQGSRIFEAVAQLNLASNWNEFRAALQKWDVPSQNFVYADENGNIGYQATGRAPIRPAQAQGLLPVAGWTGASEWQGFLAYDQLPSIYNPPAGFIATANNKVISDTYPYTLTQEWFDPGYRAQRINELLAAKDRLTLDDMRSIQAQTYSPDAAALRPYLLQLKPDGPLQQKALAYVKDWDLYLNTDQVGASIYQIWYLYLLKNTVGNKMDQSLWHDYQQFPVKHVPFMLSIMTDPNSAWFDDPGTPQVEKREDVVRRSFADALQWLSDRYGSDPAQWTWGRVHTVTFEHFFASTGIAPLAALFDSKTFPAPGGQLTVNMGWYDDPFAVVFGTSQRLIVDFSNPASILAVNSTGQNEQLFNPHRDDLTTLWVKGEYATLLFARDLVEKNAWDRLTLQPR